jgi:hypothetical protein
MCQQNAAEKDSLPLLGSDIKQDNTYIVVVLPPKVDSIHIHPPIISPVVRQRDNQLDADFRRRVDDFVETRHVDRRLAVLPALENDFRGSRPFAAVLGQAGRVVSGVFVVEAPCAEDFEAGFFGGGEAEFNVGLGVGEGEVLKVGVLVCCGSLGQVFFFFLMSWVPYIGIAAGEVEVLAV